ncbi:hypothetical protein D3C87_1762020 [compost metagenome]
MRKHASKLFSPAINACPETRGTNPRDLLPKLESNLLFAKHVRQRSANLGTGNDARAPNLKPPTPLTLGFDLAKPRGSQLGNLEAIRQSALVELRQAGQLSCLGCDDHLSADRVGESMALAEFPHQSIALA